MPVSCLNVNKRVWKRWRESVLQEWKSKRDGSPLRGVDGGLCVSEDEGVVVLMCVGRFMLACVAV